ncbi:toxin-antitoxin system, toxin component domain protein [Clostridium sp. ATCC 29733]|nr:toxin-antitoxin system, toxin component domain protein [Clostridium sp. ATCC 29733]
MCWGKRRVTIPLTQCDCALPIWPPAGQFYGRRRAVQRGIDRRQRRLFLRPPHRF